MKRFGFIIAGLGFLPGAKAHERVGRECMDIRNSVAALLLLTFALPALAGTFDDRARKGFLATIDEIRRTRVVLKCAANSCVAPDFISANAVEQVLRFAEPAAEELAKGDRTSARLLLKQLMIMRMPAVANYKGGTSYKAYPRAMVNGYAKVELAELRRKTGP